MSDKRYATRVLTTTAPHLRRTTLFAEVADPEMGHVTVVTDGHEHTTSEREVTVPKDLRAFGVPGALLAPRKIVRKGEPVKAVVQTKAATARKTTTRKV